MTPSLFVSSRSNIRLTRSRTLRRAGPCRRAFGRLGSSISRFPASPAGWAAAIDGTPMAIAAKTGKILMTRLLSWLEYIYHNDVAIGLLHGSLGLRQQK
jgi:hypothetical protein